MVYLDNSATTQTDPAVIKVMGDVMREVYGNPSSLHGIGVKAERLLQQARKVIADQLGGSPQEIIFTSGGTEANNMVIRGIAESYRNRGNHIITSQVEHPSVYDVFQYLKQKGWKVTFLPVNEKGQVRTEDVKAALTDETVLVSIMHVNNETGSIQPVGEIGELLKSYPKVMFHVDAVQSFGKIPLKPADAHIDFLTMSGHKIHGPKGIGCLYKRKNLPSAAFDRRGTRTGISLGNRKCHGCCRPGQSGGDGWPIGERFYPKMPTMERNALGAGERVKRCESERRYVFPRWSPVYFKLVFPWTEVRGGGSCLGKRKGLCLQQISLLLEKRRAFQSVESDGVDRSGSDRFHPDQHGEDEHGRRYPPMRRCTGACHPGITTSHEGA